MHLHIWNHPDYSFIDYTNINIIYSGIFYPDSQCKHGGMTKAVTISEIHFDSSFETGNIHFVEEEGLSNMKCLPTK